MQKPFEPQWTQLNADGDRRDRIGTERLVSGCGRLARGFMARVSVDWVAGLRLWQRRRGRGRWSFRTFGGAAAPPYRIGGGAVLPRSRHSISRTPKLNHPPGAVSGHCAYRNQKKLPDIRLENPETTSVFEENDARTVSKMGVVRRVQTRVPFS